MKQILVLDAQFSTIAVVDQFESLIWVDRYWAYGDFELYMSASVYNIQLFQQGRYIFSPESENIMIVESVLVETDVENGSKITVSGRSLLSILDRRIIWDQTILNAPLWEALNHLIVTNAISPTDPNRVIPGLYVVPPTDPRITALTYEGQVTGANLYEYVQAVCELNKLGIRILLDANNQFALSFYMGADRSYDQTTNPYVVFSPKFDNLISTNSLRSRKTEKNAAKVAGEGEGLERRYVAIGTTAGLDRRELYVDARDISSNEGEVPDAEYYALLLQRGEENLAENEPTDTFECTIEPNRSFKYNRDYFMGDVLSVFNEYEEESNVRLLEFMTTTDVEGVSAIPVFAVERL